MKSSNIASRAKKIKLLLMDVDGVLTPGHINVLHDGREFYTFHTRDGHGIVMWKQAGFKSGFITGRGASAVKHRAKWLSVDFLRQDCKDKVEACKEIIKSEGVDWSEIAFIGDDLVDISLLRKVGLAVSVGDAVEEVKKNCHFITKADGGRGAVRELIEIILKAKGLWRY